MLERNDTFNRKCTAVSPLKLDLVFIKISNLLTEEHYIKFNVVHYIYDKKLQTAKK